MKTLALMVALLIGVIVAGIYALAQDNTSVLIAVICAWNPILVALGWSIHHAGAYISLNWSRGGQRRRVRSSKRVQQLLQEDF